MSVTKAQFQFFRNKEFNAIQLYIFKKTCLLLNVDVRIRFVCRLSLWVKWTLWYVDMSIHFHGLVAVLCLTLISNGIQQGTALLTDAWGLSHPSSLHLASTHNHVTQLPTKVSNVLNLYPEDRDFCHPLSLHWFLRHDTGKTGDWSEKTNLWRKKEKEKIFWINLFKWNLIESLINLCHMLCHQIYNK